MNSPAEQIVEDIRIQLYDANVPLDVIRTVESCLDVSISKYDIMQKVRGLVVYDESDYDIIKKYFIAQNLRGLSPRTLKTYKCVLSVFMNGIGKHIKDVKTDDIRAYLAWLKIKGSSNAWCALNHRALSSFFKWCTNNELIEKNPMLKVETIKVAYKKEEALTMEQMEMVRIAAKTKRDKAIIEMLYSTGCRVSELCALNRDDIDWDEMEVTVLGKGNKFRTVYITQRAKYAYMEYDKIRTDKSPALFAWDPEERPCMQKQRELLFAKSGHSSDPNKARLDKSSVEFIVRNIGKRCGFRVHPHLIRKTMATHAMARGMPIDEVRIMLGHESIATTTIYAQTLKENVKSSHEKYV